MRSMRVPLLLMLFSLPAAAQESPQQQQFDIGRGVLCDTAQQLARFVALRDNGREAHTALQTVNDEAHSTTACNMVMVMFSSRKPIGELSIHGKIVSVVEITVQAFGDGVVWKRVPGVTQYTLVPEKGQNV